VVDATEGYEKRERCRNESGKGEGEGEEERDFARETRLVPVPGERY